MNVLDIPPTESGRLDLILRYNIPEEGGDYEGRREDEMLEKAEVVYVHK